MAQRGAFDFEDDRKRVYRYVERHGPIEPSVVAETLDLDPEAFQHHVTILERDDLIETDADGRLQVAIHEGEAVEHTEAGVTYTIRPARELDLSGVVGVIRSVAGAHTDLVAEAVAEQLEYEETLTRRTPTRERVVFVATVDDDVVGWVHLVTPTAARLAGTADLTLGVLPDYRGHGIGSHLLQRGVERANQRGYRKVYDSLPATNEAGIAFLEANGWSAEATREDHYEIEGDLVDEVMLARRL